MNEKVVQNHIYQLKMGIYCGHPDCPSEIEAARRLGITIDPVKKAKEVEKQ